ncbi:MAG: ATP-binding cassette domain-containing protein [Oscillospiraceae bacterium]|nr:ATP-binding cassette domain-containing protein [Oscillospiraceae bacterium]
MSLSVSIYKQLGAFTLDVQFDTGGERMALLGASGSGKSMTLACIAGLVRPDRGRIVLNGRVLFDSERRINLPPQRRSVGCLFQSYALFPHMTVRQNLLTAVRRLPRAQREAAVAEKLRAFRLAGLERLYPRQLSGGQQQRVALARVFLSAPECLLLDEPFSALDSYLRWHTELELYDLLRPYQGDVLLVSHDRGEAYRLCETVCVLTGGRSEDKTDVHTLMAQPRTLGAALISGCKNVSRIRRVGEAQAYCLDWGVTLHCAQPLSAAHTHVGLRAHSLRLARGDEPNRFDARVLRVIDDAFSTIVMLASETGGALLRMELPKEDWAAQRGSSRVTLTVPPEQVMPLMGERL